MAKAKKLPSGSWRCQAYSHTEKVRDPKTGKIKDKRIYVSFTSDDPTAKGRKEAELQAALFQANKSKSVQEKRRKYTNMTLTEAIDKYIESREILNRSPTTVQDYRCIQKNAFQDLMEMHLKDIDVSILQEAIDMEAQRPANNRDRKPISAKRLRNEWGLISAVLHKYQKGFNFDEIELPQVVPRSIELPSAATVLQIIKGREIELPVLLATWLSFSMSEVRVLTKSKSISGDYLTIREVVVDVGREAIRKDIAKNLARNRKQRIPPYIKKLIDEVDGDVLVPMSSRHCITDG